jgi:hypothetical protein
MKKVKFERCTSKQGPRDLPQWIHDQLDEFENNPPSEPYPPSRVEFIVKAIADSGMDRIELAKQMQKENGKTQITPDYIDRALAVERLETWLLMRFLSALNIKWDDYAEICSENDEKLSRILDNKRRTIQALKKYRVYGPHVHALFKPFKWLYHHKLRDHQMLIKLAMVDDEEAFNPPSAEEVGYTISKSAKSFMCKTARERFEIGGYRYYRLPNEIYDFDLDGNLLATGPINMDTPPDLMTLLVRSCCGGVHNVRRAVIPMAVKKKTRVKKPGK